MKHLLLLALLAACAEQVENVGNTHEQPGPATPATETHRIRWATTFGSLGANEANATAIASNGDVVAAVSLSGLHDFGGVNGPELAPGVSAILTRRAGSDGHELWTKTFAPADGFAGIGAVVIDHDGAVIAVGMCAGTLQIGATLLHTDPVNASETFIVKYDADGNLLWVQHDGTTTSGAGGFVVDADGNLFVGGTVYAGNYDFDARLRSFGPDGTLRWDRVFGGPGWQSINKLAVGPSGEIAIAGEFDGATSFGGAVLTPSYSNGVVAMYSNEGAHLWSSVIGPTDPSAMVLIEGVVIDSSGRAIFESQEQINNLLIQGVLPETIVRAYDPAGELRWTRSLESELRLRTLTLLSDDSIGSTAWIDPALFDFEHLDEMTGNWEMKKLGADGSLSVIEQAGTRKSGSATGNTRIWASATDATGGTAVAGEFAGTIDFGSGPLMSVDGKNSSAMLFVVEPTVAP